MKKFVCLLLTLTMLFGLASSAFAEKEVPEGYTPIRTAQELDNIRNNLSGKYILMNDIDLGEYENWVPIGTKKQPFSGIFDGNNHSIKNLIINNFVEDSSRSSSGIFAFARDSEIKNTIIDSDMTITAEKKELHETCSS